MDAILPANKHHGLPRRVASFVAGRQRTMMTFSYLKEVGPLIDVGLGFLLSSLTN
jgi:hypothetical protein